MKKIMFSFMLVMLIGLISMNFVSALEEVNKCDDLGDKIIEKINEVQDEGETVILREYTDIDDEEFFILNGPNYPHLMEMKKIDLSETSRSDVHFKDVISGTTYTSLINNNNEINETPGTTTTFVIDAKTYTVEAVDADTVKISWYPQNEIHVFEGCKVKKCTDSDDGKDYFTNGICKDKFYPKGLKDICYSSGGGNYNNLKEIFCNSNGECEAEIYECPNGCKNGVCISNMTIADYFIIVDDKSPSQTSDFKDAINLQVKLRNKKNLKFVVVKNLEIKKSDLENSVSAFIYESKAIVIYGIGLSTSDMALAVDINEYLIDMNIPSVVIKSTEVVSDDLKDTIKNINFGNQSCNSHQISIGEVYNKEGKIAVSYKSVGTGDDVIVGYTIETEQIGQSTTCKITQGMCSGNSESNVVYCDLYTNCDYPVQKPSNKYYIKLTDNQCPEVSDKAEIRFKIIDDGYVRLNEKFKLELENSVKVINYKDMKIKFLDVSQAKCVERNVYRKTKQNTVSDSGRVNGRIGSITGEVVNEIDSSDAIYSTKVSEMISRVEEGVRAIEIDSEQITKCINGQIVVKLEVTIEEEPTKYVTLKLGERKKVFGTVISFLDYYSNHKVGVFLVSKKTIDCPERCICGLDGTIDCPEECPKGTKLCPDGVCRKRCGSVDTEECKFGCLYNEGCLPIGTRVNGTFCDINRDLSDQLQEASSCENNFECSSNVCVNDECISGSLIQKIIEWFNGLFG